MRSRNGSLRRVRSESRIGRRTFLRVERLETRTTPAGLTPGLIRHAYGFDQIAFTTDTGQSAIGDGSGQTIAIVNAYHSPTVAADLDVFNRAYSINGQSLYERYGPASRFLTVATPEGQPSVNVGWAEESALDVQWAHAIAPGARILLVEARSSSLGDLMGAVDYARRQPGVSVVSMSWGTSEFRGEASFDSYFTTPAGHNGVTFVAASGDYGAPPTWPATSANVVSVGGTTLRVDSSGNYLGESAWYGSGGGVSRYVSRPDYQNGILSTVARGTPDVSYDANPRSGFSVYDSANGRGQWRVIGGTSAGAPQWAALVAISNQGRAVGGQGSLDTAGALAAIYRLPASDFHDVTSGSNGIAARAGFDLATGRGSPVANRVVAGLAGAAVTSAPRAADTGSGQTGSTASVGNRGFIVIGWWSGFGAPIFGVVFGPMAASINPVGDPAFSLATPSSAPGGSGSAIDRAALAAEASTTSDSTGTIYSRPATQGLLVFGNGVARVDWSSDDDEEDDTTIES